MSATTLAGSDHLFRFRDRVRARTAVVGVIGLGYVGLPLARAFAAAGFRVLGFDIDPARVEKLNAGLSFIAQIPDAAVAAMRAAGFEATDRLDRLDEPDALLICVPTPLTAAREPDLTYVIDSATAIAGRLRAGQLVVLESTTYPSTTRGVMLPVLERSGLVAGTDFFVAFSPEREDPGHPTHSVSHVPKVVGGLDGASGDAASALYSAIVPKVVRVSTPEVAEACKILENTYRAINIALVNEMKVLYDRMGIDVWEVIDAAKTKPFGFQAFYPGPGLGGHCLAGHEWVVVRDRSGVHAVRFAALFDRFGVREGARAGTPGVEEVVPLGLDALSVDVRSGSASYEPVTHLFRRTRPAPLLKVIADGNRHLTVTDGHPMLVRGSSGITVRLAADLEPGDELVLVPTWPGDDETRAEARSSGSDGPDPSVVIDERCPREPDPFRGTGSGTLATAEVVGVERVAPGPVYSMEVAGTHTFVTSFGIAVHNCIPLDPFYLAWIARHHGLTTRFIELAGEVNTAMPAYVIAKLSDALNDAGRAVRGSAVAILGMAYKRDVDDPRESPGFALMDLLIQKGARVTYNDPHIPVLPRTRHRPDRGPMCSQPLTAEYLAAQDCVLVATDHGAYDWAFVVRHSRLVVDTRNATRGIVVGREKIVRA